MAQAQTITPLRQRMLDDMRLRNMADAPAGLTSTRSPTSAPSTAAEPRCAPAQ